MREYTLLILLTFTGAALASDAFAIRMGEPQLMFGIHFSKHGILEYGEQPWLHTTRIVLPKLERPLPLQVPYCVNPQSPEALYCPFSRNISQHLDNLRMQAFDTLQERFSLIDQMLPESLPDSTVTRRIRAQRDTGAPLAWLGKVSYKLLRLDKS